MPRKACDYCGESFWFSNERLLTASCCSHACRSLFMATKDRSRLFDAKVEKAENGCWNWTAAADSHGYGRFGMPRGKLILAHVFSYERVNGPVPNGLELDHLCRNPRCVNPAHLEAVTHQENMRRGAVANHGVCRNGHPMTQDNITGWGARNGFQQCRVCIAARQQRNRDRINERQRERRRLQRTA